MLPAGGACGGIGAYIGYSPYCVPRVVDGVKCVIVSEALRDIEPMAWDFVMNFARDNQLQVVEACLLIRRRPQAAGADARLRRGANAKGPHRGPFVASRPEAIRRRRPAP